MRDSCKTWPVTSNGMLNSVSWLLHGCYVRLAKPLGIEPPSSILNYKTLYFFDLNFDKKIMKT
jgi:hypothetical protein